MRGGKLDRKIVLSRLTEVVSDAGTVSNTWATIGELFAELVTLASTETSEPFGAEQTASVIFRTRYLTGLTTKDRITYAGNFYDVKAITEIGRRRGLELRCECVT